MAETVVNFVLGKLADAAVKEVLLLRGVDEQVEKVRRELTRIQALLKDADRKRISDEMEKNWVQEIRDVAYWIEDVVDSAFLLEDSAETETPREKPTCFPCKTTTIKRMLRKPRKLPTLHRLGEEMNQILAKIIEINESRIRYGISNLGEGSSEPLSMQLIRPPVFPDFDDPDVVGLNQDTENIVERLLDESTKRRSVVSIVGTGGLGKTTLARKAYNRWKIKCHFNNRGWVTVSKEFKPIDLLKKIVGQFGSIDPSEHDEGVEYFLFKLNDCLKGKQYLLVLDDIWTSQFLTYLKEGLPDEENGSRVLITTRSLDVAKEADSGSEPYELKFLNEKSSIELLLKKALPNQNFNRDYPNALVDLAKEFTKKCGGLPLALSVLGGLLSKKPRYTWDTILRTKSWSFDGTCTEVLSSSYEDLSLALKSCFMYFAMLPEDYCIDAEALVRMWVAEGFIPEKKNRKLEDTAESFLEELAQRCMIQVSSRSYNDSIDECRIHDVLRDLAVQKAIEDKFVVVYSSEDDLTSCDRARRVAVHNPDCGELMKITGPSLRSLLCFVPIPDCSKQRLLKVFRTTKAEYKWLHGLPHLRYFEALYFRNAYLRCPTYSSSNFERVLCNMKFLQTLDLRGLIHDELPDCLWLVKSLRHVMQGIYFSGPSSGADLRNLQTLTRVKSRDSWATRAGIPKLSNLRELDIIIDQGPSWKVVFTLLGTLKQLACLTLSSYDGTFKVPNVSGCTFGSHLQSLYLFLYACDEIVSLGTNMFSIHLIELSLSGLQLDKDPMLLLAERLPNLKKMGISNLKYHKKEMRSPAKGFVQLDKLTLYSIKDLEELEIEKGAMPVLKVLIISSCRRLRVPPGLQHLNSLESLRWDLSYDKLASTKANEIRTLCEHVPTIDID